MKFLTVTVLCTVAAAAMGASLQPRDEAAELLLETAQLDASFNKEQQAEQHNKRSFGSSYNSYSPAYAYEEPHVPEHSTGSDLWGFKRAILGALSTAIRAIAGGSIAVKGQVIKGAGNLVATQGKLIANGGQAVSEYGRGVAARALHSAPKIASTIIQHVQSKIPSFQYHPAPVAYATPAYASPAYASPAPAAYVSHAPASYVSSGPAAVYAAPAYHRQQDGVISALTKAKLAKINAATTVGSAVGHAVTGAAGAVAGAVGSAVGSAVGAGARLAAGAAYGAANIVTGAAHGAANLAVGAADAVSNHVAHKVNAIAPAHGHAHAVGPSAGYNAAYAVPSYAGSLEDSFGDFDDSYKLAQPQINFQPSISYELH
ncbi:fibroin heavy chain-like isoform X1 [Cloeon dipterum]|uniref:fibroin heavy chain-like isoform X1 n=2 Tax=Cloeon dipterum TaxID=197152 RepID=UPI0032201DF9